MNIALVAVAETQAFSARAKSRMTESELADAIDMIARDPECGAVMKETGGIRKVRFAPTGKGKRGGLRIVYLYLDRSRPIYLLTVFAKNEKDNLTKAERNALRKVVEGLKRGSA